jgi:hypothetical protein
MRRMRPPLCEEYVSERSFLIDGEAVACDGDGLPVFDRLRYRRQDGRVFLYAFDLLGREARGGRRLGKGAVAMSVAPSSGHNRIMIYGPKPDGTYVVEFKMVDGEALAISVPASETRVLKYFQERMPYGLFVLMLRRNPRAALGEAAGATDAKLCRPLLRRHSR